MFNSLHYLKNRFRINWFWNPPYFSERTLYPIDLHLVVGFVGEKPPYGWSICLICCSNHAKKPVWIFILIPKEVAARQFKKSLQLDAWNLLWRKVFKAPQTSNNVRCFRFVTLSWSNQVKKTVGALFSLRVSKRCMDPIVGNSILKRAAYFTLLHN